MTTALTTSASIVTPSQEASPPRLRELAEDFRRTTRVEAAAENALDIARDAAGPSCPERLRDQTQAWVDTATRRFDEAWRDHHSVERQLQQLPFDDVRAALREVDLSTIEERLTDPDTPPTAVRAALRHLLPQMDSEQASAVAALLGGFRR